MIRGLGQNLFGAWLAIAGVVIILTNGSDDIIGELIAGLLTVQRAV
jgi:hypothetical protein